MSDKPISLRSKLAALKQLTNGILQDLDQLSPVDAGHLFRGLVDDYISGTYFLIELLNGVRSREDLATLTDVSQLHDDLKPTLRRLCQISREITFSVDPDRLPMSLRTRIEKLFRLSVEVMPATADPSIQDYLDNIGDRTLQPMAVVDQID